MANNMQMMFFRVHPPIPHYLVGIKVLFYNSQCIYLTATTIIFFTAMMRVGFGPANVYTTPAHTFTRACPFVPELKPTLYIFNSLAFHVSVIFLCRLSIMQRPVAVFVIRWCVVVPI